ncbi:hypothetical protein AQUCO_07600027v1 [Aquilegia coerulea]|uniref:Acyl carrier protein n=1 Tax=Aquilegia coerulea TaxID=218851 RepID=A0A2G5C8F1_AQUCA|nr:hypothetical protein AQUCO_07600027v1 [Aquilegia coerulea]
MATFLSTSPAALATLPANLQFRGTTCQHNFLSFRGPLAGGSKLTPKLKFTRAAKRSFTLPNCVKTTITCSTATPETLQTVQTMIAKQLSVDESTVTPGTKFSDLGADSLDTVEIMMALEEKFGVSIGEGAAEGLATVQDAADLIEKVKAA